MKKATVKTLKLATSVVLGSLVLVQARQASSEELLSTNTGDVSINATVDGIDTIGGAKSSITISATGSLVSKTTTILSVTDETATPDVMTTTTITNRNDGSIETTGAFSLDGSNQSQGSTLSISASGSTNNISASGD